MTALSSSSGTHIAYRRPSKDRIEVRCRACITPAVVPLDWAGGTIRCRRCGLRVKIPSRAGNLRQPDRDAGQRRAPIPPTRRQSPARAGRDRRGTPRAEPPPRAKPLLPRNPSSARDEKHERHFRALAFWYFLSAAGTALSLVLSLVLLPAGTQALPVFAFGAFSLALTAVLGYGLWTYQSWGRLGAAGLTALGLVLHFLPGPTLLSLVVVAWSGCVLWALVSNRGGRITTPEYREAVAQTRSVRVHWWLSPFFWLPLLPSVVGIGLAVLSVLL